MKPLNSPAFPTLSNSNQPKRSGEKRRGNQILAISPDYQKSSPSQRADIVSNSNFWSNCLSNKHQKWNWPLTERWQTSSRNHHTTQNDPDKMFKRTPAAYANSNSTTTNVTNQEIQPVKQQSEPVSDSNISVSSKSQKSRFGQSFANKNQNQFQGANLKNSNENLSVNLLQSTPKNGSNNFKSSQHHF